MKCSIRYPALDSSVESERYPTQSKSAAPRLSKGTSLPLAYTGAEKARCPVIRLAQMSDSPRVCRCPNAGRYAGKSRSSYQIATIRRMSITGKVGVEAGTIDKRCIANCTGRPYMEPGAVEVGQHGPIVTPTSTELPRSDTPSRAAIHVTVHYFTENRYILLDRQIRKL